MPSPSNAERQVHIMQVLQEQGHVSVARLSRALDVSEVTIRKDLRTLESRKLLYRTHGGAMLMDHYLYDVPFDEKAQQHADEKRRIARAAVELIEDGDAIVLNAGTTTTQVARHLRGRRKNLSVLTSSLHVALELMSNLDVDLTILGGMVRPTTAAVVGHFAERMLQELSFRKLFLGGDGFDVDFGVTATNAMESHVTRMMVRAAEQTVVVMDASKFGRRGLSRICGAEEVAAVITDDRLPDETAAALERAGLRLIVV